VSASEDDARGGAYKQAAARQATPARGEPVEVKPLEALKGELSSCSDSKCLTERKVIVGSLRITSEDRWACKVPSCTGGFHRLKDCWLFHTTQRTGSSWQIGTAFVWAV
jgi:hypothetical protein